ncbi:MAG: methyltransferase domain-containing protein, partial [Pseudomonadota bacterium]
DINQPAVDYGVEKFGVDLRAEFWSSESDYEFDILACIMVLEHLEDPRPLFAEMAKAAARFKAKVFISVPFLERNRWSFIQQPDPKKPNTPFFNNDVHVTHFSKEGLIRLARQHGMQTYQWLQPTDTWSGFVFDWQSSDESESVMQKATKKIQGALRAK